MLSHRSEDGVLILEIDIDCCFCPCTLPPIPAHLSLHASLQARNCGPQDTTKSFSTSSSISLREGVTLPSYTFASGQGLAPFPKQLL